MILDRLPERRIRRVVDDDHAFEIRIVEPRHRIERLLEHLRRLEIGRDVDRDFREATLVADGGRRQVAALTISRRGPRPNATAAISSMRAIAISTSGTSRIRPSVSAKAEPKTK